MVTKKAKSYRAKECSAMDGVRVGWQPMHFVCRSTVAGSNPLNLCVVVLLLFLLAGCAVPLKAVPIKVGDKTKYYVIGNTKIGEVPW